MVDTPSNHGPLAFIGFGEAAHAVASGLRSTSQLAITTYDLKLLDAKTANSVLARANEARVQAFATPTEALADARVAFCLVTADQALNAARTCAPHLAPGTLWLDGNSCAPQTKQRAAEVIEAAGARYIDVAVMAPVYPGRHEVPLLLAGPHAAEAAEHLTALGMMPKVSGVKVGDASSVKMLRSVMIKGLEALTSECLLAARRAGVEDSVLASLQASDPGFNWRARGSYNLERMMVHGVRRAAEMREVCLTLQGLGIPDWMSQGTVQWQDKLGELHLDPGEDDLAARSDTASRYL